MKDKKIEKVIDYLYLELVKAENENKFKTCESLKMFIHLLDSIVDDSYEEFIEEYL